MRWKGVDPAQLEEALVGATVLECFDARAPGVGRRSTLSLSPRNCLAWWRTHPAGYPPGQEAAVRKWFDLSSVEAIVRGVERAVDQGLVSRGAPPVPVALQQAWGDATAAEASRLVEATRELLDTSSDKVRAHLLAFIQNRSGQEMEALIESLIRVPPPWFWHAHPMSEGAVLGRDLFIAALGDVATRHPGLHPHLASLAKPAGAMDRWVIFLANLDAEQRGFEALRDWMGAGGEPGMWSDTLGVIYGSWGKARLVDVATLFANRPQTEQDAFLSEALFSADAAMKAKVLQAMGRAGP